MTKVPRPVAVAIVFCPVTHRVLMITSRKHPNLWIIPKGGVEKGETSGQAAAREAFEEAGIPSNLDPEAVSSVLITITKPKELWHVHAVRLGSEGDLVDDWIEKDERKREWVAVPEARSRIEQWTKGDLLDGELEESEARGSLKKKTAKSGQMQQALEAFVEWSGWAV